MKFVDEATIDVIAGKGGDGVASFRREKFIPKGGPNGGDGGRGGSIYARADRNTNTLSDFRYRRIHRAKAGENGRSNDQYGAAAPDIILRVPVGTIFYDAETNQQLFDLNRDGEKVLLAAGGSGGLGNLHFKSSTNRTPRQFTHGKPGEKKRLRLELKVLADVGLLGLPNAGKSTFIRKVSNARPKVADYPFTTLTPQLGVVDSTRGRSFVIADIPGLIEGASGGAGLGHQFLRHLARTRVLLHLIDVSSIDPDIDVVKQAADNARVLVNELKLYDQKLYDKPRWLVLNKVDMVENPDALQKEICQELNWQGPVYTISALSGQGVETLVNDLQNWLDSQNPDLSAQQPTISPDDPRFQNSAGADNPRFSSGTPD